MVDGKCCRDTHCHCIFSHTRHHSEHASPCQAGLGVCRCASLPAAALLRHGAQRTRHYTVISAGVESSRLSAPLGLERLATQSPSQLSPCGALDYEHGNLVRRPPVSGRERPQCESIEGQSLLINRLEINHRACAAGHSGWKHACGGGAATRGEHRPTRACGGCARDCNFHSFSPIVAACDV